MTIKQPEDDMERHEVFVNSKIMLLVVCNSMLITTVEKCKDLVSICIIK